MITLGRRSVLNRQYVMTSLSKYSSSSLPTVTSSSEAGATACDSRLRAKAKTVPLLGRYSITEARVGHGHGHVSAARCSLARQLVSVSRANQKSTAPSVGLAEGGSPGRPHGESKEPPTVPAYLQEVYWWAYVHPNAVHVFERQWLVDAILWGNFRMLRDDALDELCAGDRIHGRTLQVACVYGDFTQLLAERMVGDSAGATSEAGETVDTTSTLDVVDVAPVQIENIKNKLRKHDVARRLLEDGQIRINHCNAEELDYSNGAFNQVILFFLLHEMPENVRRNTLAQAFRVLKKGGKMVLVDYHCPTSYLHPHRYLMPVVLSTLEPFAMDLWKREINEWLPDEPDLKIVRKELFFGGLYQKVVIAKE